MTEDQAQAGLPEGEPCGYCGGFGEIYGHADACDNDSCALAGGMYDCLGKVEPCPACNDASGPDQQLADGLAL